MQRRLPAPESLRRPTEYYRGGAARKTQTLLSSSLLGPSVTQPDGWSAHPGYAGPRRGCHSPALWMSSWLRHSQPFRKVSPNQDPQQAPALPGQGGDHTYSHMEACVSKHPRLQKLPSCAGTGRPRQGKQASFSSPSAPAPGLGPSPSTPSFLPLSHPPCGFCYHFPGSADLRTEGFG